MAIAILLILVGLWVLINGANGNLSAILNGKAGFGTGTKTMYSYSTLPDGSQVGTPSLGTAGLQTSTIQGGSINTPNNFGGGTTLPQSGGTGGLQVGTTTPL